jgi:hypothetical protein
MKTKKDIGVFTPRSKFFDAPDLAQVRNKTKKLNIK